MATNNPLESINTFEKGLDRDSSNQNKPKGTYEYAENLINNSEEGKFILSQEAGIVETNITGVDENPFQWITIGSVYIDDMEILFQGFVEDVNPEFTDSRIGYKNIRTGEFQVVYQNHERLNFNIDYHINNPQAKKIYNGDINLYFTDNFNPPKFLRLIYQSDLSGLPYIVDQDVLNLNADFEEPLIDYVQFIEGGGNAPISTIHFFLQYVDKYGNTTRYSNLTNGVPVISTTRSASLHTDVFLTNYAQTTSINTKIPFGKLNAISYNSNSSKSIRLRIDHVDTTYSFFRVGYMYYKDNVYTPIYKVIDNLYNIPVSTDLHIDNVFQDITFFEPTLELDKDQVTQIAKKFEYTHAKCMAQNQNYLLLGNLRNKYENLPDSLLEVIANNIDVRVAIKPLITTTDTYNSADFNQAYDHEQSSFRYKGYKRAEVYSFGFRLIYKGGYKSKVIHIPAKEKVTEFNANLRYILPTTGDNLTGTYYSSDTYKIGSSYIITSTIPNIRHHVMPDWYHEDATTNTYRISQDNFLTANTTTVNALGIYFENIDLHTLPEDILSDLVGLEFVRQTREDSQNKRILAQGITRLVQRPLTRSGSYPVILDEDADIKEFQEQVLAKDFAFSNFTNPYLNIPNHIEVDNSNAYWDVTDPQRHLRNDGLVSGTTIYGFENKRIDESGYVYDFTDSLSSPLDSFGHISKWFMPNYSGSTPLTNYSTYDEFILNIISPETEFNLVQLPSNLRLELRDRMYFETFDVTSVDSLGNAGSLVKIDNSLGAINYGITTVGTRASTGGNGLLRSAANSTYNDNGGIGPANYKTRILQGSLNQNTTVLISKPNQSKISLGFNTKYTSDFLSTLFISSGSNFVYPNRQDIVPIPDLQITDNYTNNDPIYKYLVKHSYVNNGLYLIPSLTSYLDLRTIIKENINNNLRYEVKLYNGGSYTLVGDLGLTEFATFPSTPYYQKIYRSTPIVGNNSTVAYDAATTEQKLDVDYSSTPVFDIISEIPNQYGTIYNAEYFVLQVSYNINKVATTNIGSYSEPIFSGDTFISWYANNNGGYGENYSVNTANSVTGVSFDAGDTYLLHKIHTYNNNIMYFPVETSINTHFRNSEENQAPYFPLVSLKDTFGGSNNIYRLAPHFNSDGYYLNYSYNQNNVNLSTTQNQLTGTGGSLGLYPNRIIYSAQSVDGEIDDQYRNFLTQNFKDVPKDTGEIWNMYQYSNDIYAHTLNALWKTYMLQTTGVTTNNGDEFVLGQSQLFGLTPQKILTKEGSSGGTKSAWGYMITPYGLLFIDNYGNKIYKLINDTLEEISFNGMMRFFANYTQFATTRGDFRDYSHYIDDSPYNPINGHGWHFGYDDFNKRVVMTKRSSIESEYRGNDLRRPEQFFKEFTISYSFLSNSFLGFSSYLPIYYINSGNHLITIPTNKNKPDIIKNYIGTHNDFTNPCNFYKESPEDSILKFTCNEYPQIEKTFDNIVIDMYNMSQAEDLGGGNYFNKTLVINRGNTNDPISGVPIKDTMEVETINQYSDVNELYYNNGTADHYVHYDDNKRSVKYFKQYRIALPKSRTSNQSIAKDNQSNIISPSPVYNTLGDRFKDKYLQVTLRWRNYERFSFLLNFIKTIFRINRR